jgi:hypothetical protein
VGATSGTPQWGKPVAQNGALAASSGEKLIAAPAREKLAKEKPRVTCVTQGKKLRQ